MLFPGCDKQLGGLAIFTKLAGKIKALQFLGWRYVTSQLDFN